MLKQIEENYKYLMITLLVIYLINFAYFDEIIITFTTIGLAIILESFKQRQHIKKFTYSQLSIIGIVLLAGISAAVYIVILSSIFLQQFNLPETIETIFLIISALVCLYVLGYFMKKIYAVAMGK